MRSRSVVCAIALLCVAFPATAAAHGKAKKTTKPHATTNGLQLQAPTWRKLPTTSRSHPFGGDLWSNRGVGLAKHGFVEEEYLVSGAARVYQAVPQSDYVAKVINHSSYTTRAIIRRPKDMRTWSGNVLVEYMNVSDGLDLQVLWTKLYEKIFNANDVYVAFTGKGNVIPILRRFDPARYGAVDMPNPLPPSAQTCGSLPDDPNYNPNLSKLFENGLLWDMWSEIGLSLKTASSPLGRVAKRLYATGESQSANALQNYYAWFGGNRTTVGGKPIYDGIFAETPTRNADGALNQCGGALPTTDPQRTENVIPDRGVPYFTVNSQWDAWKNPPPPSKRYRVWQVTGSNHVDRDVYDHVYPIAADLAKGGVAGPDALPWQAGISFELYSPAGWFCDDASRPEVPLPMVQRTGYDYLKRWVTRGTQPPIAPYITRTPTGDPVLDADGNAVGGLRLPEIQVPVAKYVGVLWGDCNQAHLPFTPERLAQLYSTHDAYVRKFAKAARESVRGGYLRSDDARELISRAEDRPIP